MSRKFNLLCCLVTVGTLAWSQPGVRNAVRSATSGLVKANTEVRRGEPGAEVAEVLNKRRAAVQLKQATPRKVEGDNVIVTYSATQDLGYMVYTWTTEFEYDMSAKKVKMTDLFGDVGNTEPVVLESPYEDGRISFKTKSPYSESDPGCTMYAEYSEATAGEKLFVCGGKFTPGSWDLDTREDISYMEVSDDLSTVTVPEGYGLGLMISCESYDFPYMMLTSANPLIEVKGGASLDVTPLSIDFGNIMASKTAVENITLTSTGSEPVPYTITFSDSHFSASSEIMSGQVPLFQTVTVPVTFRPGVADAYTGTATIKTETDTYEIQLKGEATAVETDFADLVTSGDGILDNWKNDSEYPFSMDAETPHMARCLRIDKAPGSAWLEASYSSSKPMKITTYIDNDCSFRDTLNLYVDGHKVLSRLKEVLKEDVEITVPSGQHTIRWSEDLVVYAMSKSEYFSMGKIRISEFDDEFGSLSDGSATGFVTDNAFNYNGKMRPAGESGEFSFHVNATEPSFVCFDVEAATPGQNVVVTANGVTTTVAEPRAYFCNFPGAGDYEVKVKLNGGQTSVSNIQLKKGEWFDRTDKYLVSGRSMLVNNQSSPTAGPTVSGIATFRFTGDGKVYIDGLVPQDDVTMPTTVMGRMKEGRIYIPTPLDKEHMTLYGYDDGSFADYEDYRYYVNRYWLVSGELPSLRLNEYKTKWQDGLYIDISEDGNVLTPETGFGIWISWSHFFNNSGVHMSEFIAPGAKLVRTGVNAELTPSVDELDLGNTYAGKKSTKTFSVLNASAPVDFEIDITGSKAFSCTPASGTAKANGAQTLTVTFSPDKAGSHEATLTILTDNYEKTVRLTGVATDAPDYGTLAVKGGEMITWETSAEHPWSMEDNSAVSGNLGKDSSKSTLTASFNIPSGYYGRFYAQVEADSEIDGDTFNAKADDRDVILSYGYFNNDFVYLYGEGDHTATFEFEKDATRNYISDDCARISNVRLELYPASVSANVLQGRVQFKRSVSADQGDSAPVYIVNRGGNPVTLKSADVPEPFAVTGIMNRTVAPGDTLAVDLICNPTAKAWLYEGEGVIHTSAGELRFDISAHSDFVHYVGSYDSDAMYFPVNAENFMYGKYGSCTSSVYPEDTMKGLEGKYIHRITFYTVGVPNIDLQAKDTRWCFGTMEAGTANFEDEDFGEDFELCYRGPASQIRKYEHTVNLMEPFKYDGGDFIYYYNQASYEPFAYGFYYRQTMVDKHLSADWGDTFGLQTLNCYPVMRIYYSDYKDISGTDNISDGLSPVAKVEYYNIAGMRLEQPAKGVNIVVTTYEDGTRRSEKRIAK